MAKHCRYLMLLKLNLVSFRHVELPIMLALCSGWMKHYIFSLVPLLGNIFTDLVESVYSEDLGDFTVRIWVGFFFPSSVEEGCRSGASAQ